ncbi:HlyD family type I secretion periplasmic adaptor subunit [Pseudoxanthobacter sp.]|uniref:HlyD family type I secretion periplasmic adaptor subunit n=1 Tax=Pseudoxanthobacter sp. TaxID=1925742 RepID=UPI002FE42143
MTAKHDLTPRDDIAPAGGIAPANGIAPREDIAPQDGAAPQPDAGEPVAETAAAAATLMDRLRRRVAPRAGSPGRRRRQPPHDPGDPAHALRFGAVVCVVVLVVFGGWSALTSLQSAVVAPGVIAAEGRTRAVQHLDGGIVSAILVKDGDEVQAGDVLVRLDTTRLASERGIVENRLYEALARQARLEAERDDAPAMTRPPLLDAMVAADRDWASLAPAADPALTSALASALASRADPKATEPPAQTGLEIANRVFSGQDRLFHARRDTLKAQVARLEAGIAQSREQMAGIDAQRASLERQRDLIARELDGARKLYEKGLMPLPRVLALERQQADLEGNIAARGADKAAIGQSIGQLQLQILELQRDAREKVLQDLREADSDVQDLTEQRIAALDKLNRTDIRAPVSGRVNGLAFHTIGGVVRPADVVMEIVPDDEALIVEARADPAEVDQLHAGQSARIRLTAFDQRTTPEIDGTLLVVSPDRLTDPQSGAPYYALKVAIADDGRALLGPDRPLVAGMPADVFVVAGARSPLSYLMKPLTDQMARALREE